MSRDKRRRICTRAARTAIVYALQVDTSGDGRIDVEEFKAGCAQLSRYGLEVKNPEAEFARIDANGGGIVLFDEFAHWVRAAPRPARAVACAG